MILEGHPFQNPNLSKATFDSLYERPDPREYYRVLYGLDYVIPDLAKSIFRTLIANRRYELARPVRVLDVGCSYGVNAALIRHPLDIRRLAQRYASPEMRALDSESLVQLDRHYFRSWPSQSDARFVGLDSSEPAVRYALNAGLIDAAVSANFEDSSPNARESDVLSDLDLIISTGCVGYVSERTFHHLLEPQDKGRMPWVVNFVLRMFPYHVIEQQLAQFGLVTEKLKGVTFIQRRFHSKDEASATLELLESKGVDIIGKEAEGLLHADLFVSRPARCIERSPLNELVSITSGVNRRYGRRFARSQAQKISLLH